MRKNLHLIFISIFCHKHPHQINSVSLELSQTFESSCPSSSSCYLQVAVDTELPYGFLTVGQQLPHLLQWYRPYTLLSQLKKMSYCPLCTSHTKVPVNRARQHSAKQIICLLFKLEILPSLHTVPHLLLFSWSNN